MSGSPIRPLTNGYLSWPQKIILAQNIDHEKWTSEEQHSVE